MKQVPPGEVRGIWLWAAAAGLAALYSLGLFWGLPSILTPASDSIAPLGPLAFAADLKDPTKSYIYPAVHQITLLFIYAAALMIGKLSGAVGSISGAWPYGFHDPNAVFTWLIFISNLVSMIMGLGVLGFMLRTKVFEPSQRWFGPALLGLSGVFVYYARVANMDAAYLFWWMLSYTMLWSFLFQRPASRYLIISGVAGAFAIGTKDQSAALLLGSGLLVLLMTPSADVHTPGASLRRIKSAAIFSICLLGAYAAVAVITNPQRWLRHVRYVTMNHAAPGCDCSCFPCPEFPVTLWGETQLAIRALARMGHVLSVPGVVLGLAGLILLAMHRRWREFWFIALPAATYYAIVFAGVRATEERYLLPLAILLCFGASVALGLMWSRVKSRVGRWVAGGMAGALLIYQGVTGAYPITYIQLRDSKRALAKELPTVAAVGSGVLIVNMFSFGVPNADVYKSYRLMHPPGHSLQPLSTHGEHAFSPFSPDYHWVLSGTHEPYSNEYVKDAVLIRSWTYPEWVKKHVYVPAIHEFALYERR